MMFTFLMMFIFLRTLLYFWVAVEFLALAKLYRAGYNNHKKTRIILSLQRLLFFLGVLFGVLTIVPLLSVLLDGWFRTVTNWLSLFLIPVLYYIRQFRKWSLERSEMQLPDEK